MSKIHTTAIVDASAQLAEDVEIGPYCVVGPNVEIGARSVLHNHVTIASLTTVGEENVFYPYSVIGADPQDRKFRGEKTVCTVGNRNAIREHVTIHRGTANGGGKTTLGSDNLIMVASHVAHDCELGDRIVIANQVMLAGHVHIQDGANIGGGAGLHHFTTVGRCAFIGGLARISKDVPPYMIVEGNPAEVRAVNSIAMMRNGFSSEHIEAMKESFKRLFRDNGAPIVEKLEELRGRYHNVPAVIELCDALEATSDGVHGRAMEVFRHDNKRAASVSPSFVHSTR